MFKLIIYSLFTPTILPACMILRDTLNMPLHMPSCLLIPMHLTKFNPFLALSITSPSFHVRIRIRLHLVNSNITPTIHPSRHRLKPSGSTLPITISSLTPFTLKFILLILRRPNPTSPSIHKPQHLPRKQPFHDQQPERHERDDQHREGRRRFC